MSDDQISLVEYVVDQNSNSDITTHLHCLIAHRLMEYAEQEKHEFCYRLMEFAIQEKLLLL